MPLVIIYGSCGILLLVIGKKGHDYILSRWFFWPGEWKTRTLFLLISRQEVFKKKSIELRDVLVPRLSSNLPMGDQTAGGRVSWYGLLCPLLTLSEIKNFHFF
jgi:hypothetical protein